VNLLETCHPGEVRSATKWLVADWKGNKGHVFEDVISSLQALGHSVQIIPRSDPGRRNELVDAIRCGKYHALLTWQRFYRMQKELTSAINESGIKTLFMDFGFLPHYNSVVFDTRGENAESSWPAAWAEGGPSDLTDEDLETADSLMQAEAARARLMKPPAEPEFQRVPQPFIFLPLQRPGDAVVKFDSSVHDFGKLFRRVLFLARNTHFVVCKTHPLDQNLDLGVPDRIGSKHLVVRRSFGNENEDVCDFLLSHSSLVVGVNSNMLFRAMLFGTPVIATGRGWYSGSGALHEVDGLDGLTTLSVPLPDVDAQRRYLAKCMTRQLYFHELGDTDCLQGMLKRLGLDVAA
jgi:hypothetical protein